MNAITIFLVICLILGLWVRPRARFGLAAVAGLAFLLVVFFWLFPWQL